MSKSKPKKVPQTIWIPVGPPPTPLRQCPNMSRFLFRLASLTYNTQSITITPDPICSGAQGGDGVEHRPQQEGGGGLGGGKQRGGGGQRLSQIKGAENKSPLYDS